MAQGNAIAYEFYQGRDKPFVKLTYQELAQQVQAIAAELLVQNLQAERVLLVYPAGLEFIAAFLGCLSAGAIAVPVYPPKRNPKLSRLRNIITDSDAQGVLTLSHLGDKITTHLSDQASSLKYVFTDQINNKNNQESDFEIAPKKIAFLQYTSGSTGNPKGVKITHKNIIHNSELIYRSFGHSSISQGVSWLPSYHDMGLIGGILQPLYGGFPVTLLSPVDFLRQPLLWLEIISNSQANTSGAPNFAYDLCIEKVNSTSKPKIDLSSWDLAFIGAEPIRAETLDKFAATFAEFGFKKSAFYPCYGMAETTLMVLGGVKGSSSVISKHNDSEVVSCGKVNHNQEIIIVNPENGELCPEKEIGEIWIKSNDSTALGYWKKKQLTTEIFQAQIIGETEHYLRTGDLGFIEDDQLFITGRIKDVIIIRGQNYYPHDLERVVERSHPALQANSGAAFTVEVANNEQLVIVQEVKRSFVKKLGIFSKSGLQTNSQQKLQEEIEEAIRSAISQEFGLGIYEIQLLKTGSISKTSSGKIQRYLCKEKYLAETREQGSRGAEGDKGGKGQRDTRELLIGEGSVDKKSIQDWLSQWLSRKLQISITQIEITKAFADYGIDSVMAVELAQDLEDWLPDNFEIEPTVAWNFPNIEALARYLAEREGAGEQESKGAGELRETRETGETREQDVENLSEDELVRSLLEEIALAKERNN